MPSACVGAVFVDEEGALVVVVDRVSVVEVVVAPLLVETAAGEQEASKAASAAQATITRRLSPTLYTPISFTGDPRSVESPARR